MTSRAYRRERERCGEGRGRKWAGPATMTSRAYYVKKGVINGKIYEDGKRGPNNKCQDSLKGKSRPVATLRCAPEPDPGEY